MRADSSWGVQPGVKVAGPGGIRCASGRRDATMSTRRMATCPHASVRLHPHTRFVHAGAACAIPLVSARKRSIDSLCTAPGCVQSVCGYFRPLRQQGTTSPALPRSHHRHHPPPVDPPALERSSCHPLPPGKTAIHQRLRFKYEVVRTLSPCAYSARTVATPGRKHADSTRAADRADC